MKAEEHMTKMEGRAGPGRTWGPPRMGGGRAPCRAACAGAGRPSSRRGVLLDHHLEEACRQIKAGQMQRSG